MLSEKLMPFGKHKDKPIKDIPINYLRWLIKGIPTIDVDLKKEIEETIIALDEQNNDVSPILNFGKFAGQSVLDLPHDNVVITWAKWILEKDPNKFNKFQKQEIEKLSKLKLKKYTKEELENLVDDYCILRVNGLRKQGLEMLGSNDVVEVSSSIFKDLKKKFSLLFGYSFSIKNKNIIKIKSCKERKLDGWQAEELLDKYVLLTKIKHDED